VARPRSFVVCAGLALVRKELPLEPTHDRHSKSIYQSIGAVATIAITLVAVGGFVLALRGAPGRAATSPTATPKPIHPSSVALTATASGIPTTTQSQLTVPSGTSVTLTVTPNHPLDAFQIFDLGVYAHDPYPFSELNDCRLADTCSYTVSEASGTHTYTGFLGDIGGLILANSNDITITWG
jgi:hypothetical protein